MMDKKTLKMIPNPIIIYDTYWKVHIANPAALRAHGLKNSDVIAGKDIRSLVHPSGHEKLESVQQELKYNDHAQPSASLIRIQKNSKATDSRYLSQFTRLTDYPVPGSFSYMESAIQLKDTNNLSKENSEDVKNFRILSENIPGLEMFLIDSNMHVHCRLGRETLKQKWHNHQDEGADFLEYFNPEIISILQPLVKIAFHKTPVSREFSMNNKFFSLRLIPLNIEQPETLCVVILQNITDTKLTENKLKLYQQQAVEANRAKDIFVAKISHEIRTPLNAILGFTEQLTHTRLTRKQSDYLDVVNNSSRHLLTIIEDILVLSKIESGTIEQEEVPFKIPDVFDQIEHLLEIKYRKKNLTFLSYVDKFADTTMLGDVSKLKQVLINLANNAIKFTSKGRVEINAIVADQNQDGKKIRFEVSDTGIGINPDEIKNIFKPFSQVNNLFDRNFSGSGLGLTISKDLVSSMGGKLSVQSIPGQGSTFSFTLTLKKGSQNPEKQENDNEKQEINLPQNLKILFVDDDPVNILLGKIILRKHRVRAHFADSGALALRKFRPGKYHLVFLDINMPDINGLDVVQHIRETEVESPPSAKTTIIAMTANALKKHLKKYLKHGMDSILLKPYTEKALIQKIIKHSPEFHTENSVESGTRFPETSSKIYDLSELLKVTKYDHAFTSLMLNTFVENSENMIDKIRHSLSQDNYYEIGEVAHKLIPTVEQLGIKKARDLFKKIETLYLYTSNSEKDPNLIIMAIEELKIAIQAIKQVLKETETQDQKNKGR
jgi:signal transduction histidine kinase/CheY-like chemotaxis protein